MHIIEGFRHLNIQALLDMGLILEQYFDVIQGGSKGAADKRYIEKFNLINV